MDYKDDGLIFNRSIGWQTYLGGTLIGGAIVMTASCQMMMTVGITIPNAQVIGALGALGALYMFAKGSGARIGHNQYENKQIDQLCKKYNLSKARRRILHDYIQGENLTYK